MVIDLLALVGLWAIGWRIWCWRQSPPRTTRALDELIATRLETLAAAQRINAESWQAQRRLQIAALEAEHEGKRGS
jgi:hypothetical protein